MLKSPLTLSFFFILLLSACHLPTASKSEKVGFARQDEAMPAQQNILSKDSFLFALSQQIITTVQSKDFVAFSSFVPPEEYVRFSPYAYVDTVNDQRLSRYEIAAGYSNERLWGAYHGSGEPIQLSLESYLEKFMCDEDFVKSGKKSMNNFQKNGNTVNNLREVYKEEDFTEFYYPGTEANQFMDWKALRLVFRRYNDNYFLVGVVHDQWTI